MNITVFFITLYIFIDTVAYGIYEIKNKNKLGGFSTLLMAVFMMIFVNYFTFRFN